jgi:hypothetical protein
MGEEIHWERLGYQSRIDAMEDEVPGFVEAVLASVDAEAARAAPHRWAVVCRFFAGCAAAAQAQDPMRLGAGGRVAAFFRKRFPGGGDRSTDGFDEFMDWLSRPEQFRPTRLREMLDRTP